jgi:adenosine deaminase
VTAPTLDGLPKVELHCHIEGTMRPETVVELATKNRIPVPTTDPSELYRYANLTEFLNVFWLVQATLVTRNDWALLAYESVIDGAAHGLAYREAFFTPGRHLADGHDLADIVAGLDDGLAAAEDETGVRCRLIFDIDRAFGPAAALASVERLVELIRARAPGTERLIGLGMDSTELGIDPASFAASYALAAGVGLHRTAHQGENSPASAIRTALDVLGIERIDHGISVFEDADLVARMRDDRIAFTVCPGANVRINPDVCSSLDAHVFPRMRSEGLLATLNTDDPALVGLDLDLEYAEVAAAYGYGVDEMRAIVLDAVDACWAPDDERRALRALVEAA